MDYQLETPHTAEEIVIHNFLHIVAVSFLFYDHLLTSGIEIQYLWKRHKTQSSYWFFFNRYFAFFGNIAVTILGFTTLPHQRSGPTLFTICRRYNLFRQLMLIINQVLVCILLTIRIYALYGCSLRVLAYMVGSGAVLAGVSVWSLFGQKTAPAQQGSGCHVGISSVTAIHLAGAWEALFVYDSILFGLTMFKTWRARNEFGLYGRNGIPILQLIFRDGAIYFAVMALANLANILTFYLCGPFLRGGLSTFASSISVTMMSRLMLNLHETADTGIYSTATFTNTNVEYSSPTNMVELDTLWSGALEHGRTTFASQSFGLADQDPSPGVPTDDRSHD